MPEISTIRANGNSFFVTSDGEEVSITTFRDMLCRQHKVYLPPQFDDSCKPQTIYCGRMRKRPVRTVACWLFETDGRSINPWRREEFYEDPPYWKGKHAKWDQQRARDAAEHHPGRL